MYSFAESVGTSFLGVRLSPESVQLTENLAFTFSTANGLEENAAVGEFVLIECSWITIIMMITVVNSS